MRCGHREVQGPHSPLRTPGIHCVESPVADRVGVGRGISASPDHQICLRSKAEFRRGTLLTL
jgi:hypothetical protein